MSSQPKVSIVLSLRNEEAVLHELISRLQKTLQKAGLTYELLFINDDSTDKSAAILENYALQFNEIKIVHMSRRFGVQACILAGIEQAQGEAVITMDADLQDPPELIPQMIQKWQEGHEIVHMVRSSRDGENPVKMHLTKLAYHCLALISEVPLPIEAGDFKLLSRRAVTELLKHTGKMPYLRGLIASLGFSQTSISYRREKRFAGTSHFALLGRGPIETFFSAVTSFSSVPLYAFFVLGFVLIVISLLIFSALLFLGIWGVWNSKVWLFNFFFFLLSANLCGIGLLGIYLWNILKQTQNRPLYTIDRKINFE